MADPTIRLQNRGPDLAAIAGINAQVFDGGTEGEQGDGELVVGEGEAMDLGGGLEEVALGRAEELWGRRDGGGGRGHVVHFGPGSRSAVGYGPGAGAMEA